MAVSTNVRAGTDRLTSGLFATDISDRFLYPNYANQGVLDLTYGGQFGYAPVMSEWVSNQAYVRRQLIPILLEAPEFFTLMEGEINNKYWSRTLKAIVELHCKSIDGFNAGLTVETNDHPVGGGGEMQDEVVDVKRARTTPKFSFVEKTGLPIQTFFQYWIQYGLMDPDTKYALAGTLSNGGDAASSTSIAPYNLLPSWYSMTMLFIEPDPTHTNVVKSWLTTNMFPKSNGDIIGKRDLTSASEILTLDIEFTGVSQTNLGTNILAQKILDNINIRNANPFKRPAFISSVQSKLENLKGYSSGANFLSQQVAKAGNPPSAQVQEDTWVSSIEGSVNSTDHDSVPHTLEVENGNPSMEITQQETGG